MLVQNILILITFNINSYRQIINDQENKQLFRDNDNEILKKLEQLKEEEKSKQDKYVSLKTMKNNLDDFSYFIENA